MGKGNILKERGDTETADSRSMGCKWEKSGKGREESFVDCG